MVKRFIGGGGPRDYIVSYLGQVIVIVIGRPRSLTIIFDSRWTTGEGSIAEKTVDIANIFT